MQAESDRLAAATGGRSVNEWASAAIDRFNQRRPPAVSAGSSPSSGFAVHESVSNRTRSHGKLPPLARGRRPRTWPRFKPGFEGLLDEPNYDEQCV